MAASQVPLVARLLQGTSAGYSLHSPGQYKEGLNTIDKYVFREGSCLQFRPDKVPGMSRALCELGLMNVHLLYVIALCKTSAPVLHNPLSQEKASHTHD